MCSQISRGITQPSPCRFVAKLDFLQQLTGKIRLKQPSLALLLSIESCLVNRDPEIMVHSNPPHNWLVFHPPTKSPKKNQGLFFIVQSDFAGFSASPPGAKLSMPSPRAVRRPVGGSTVRPLTQPGRVLTPGSQKKNR